MSIAIFNQKFNTPYNAAPFSAIKEDDYLPAFKEQIEFAEQQITEISENLETPNFKNTLEALAYSGEGLDLLSNIFFNLNSAETNDNIQKIAQNVSPLLSEHASKVAHNKQLFERIKTVYDQKDSLSLNEEQHMLLEETYKGFVRSGALLSIEDQKILEELNKELSLNSLQFGQNALGATNSYWMHIIEKPLMKGIPEAILEQYEEEAKERGLDGWVITLQYPSYAPFMTYSENRDLRKELSMAFGRRAFDNGTFDNQELIKKIVKQREQKAKLLAYKDYANFVLEERMAKDSTTVSKFLKELLEKAKPYAQNEINEIKAIALSEGIKNIASYDHAFYAEKLRKQKFDLNDEELKPYFPLEKVEAAVFNLANTLFGLSFKEVNTVDKYHNDVKTYGIQENGQYKALLYVDYFPRKGKRAGAWMTSYKNQCIKDGENIRPHISVVCNFSKPTADTPSLLTFQEVTTLFHEFGHALHGVLANTQYPTLSGTSVKWDFVELPSQFLENYCYEPEFLNTFAQHYKTGERLPSEKIEKLSESKNFMEGYQTLRQIGFGLLDMAYHSNANDIKDIKSFETEVTEGTNIYPSNPDTSISTAFSHIFGGGYAAGYYSYKWAEVLDADAFQYFKENGLFNKEIAAKYKTLLSSGGTKDPMELYKDFRGRAPKVESLLIRAFGNSSNN
ncbi:MAG TPA: M3 family metallopeptidase [Edaphocola sp.]|nr:M3 family metallopeptidase [Edaphocola sp.]